MNKTSTTIQDHLDRAAKACGGFAKLAELVGASATSPAMWKARSSVPPQYGALIEKASGNIVRRWHLRPADWHRIWPELIGTEGAPAIPEEARHAA